MGFSNILKLNSCGTTRYMISPFLVDFLYYYPKIFISPVVFKISELTILINVDLPAPLTPKRAKKSPFSTSY